MKTNVGGADRIIRIVLGLGIIAAVVYLCKIPCVYKPWAIGLGAVIALTGLFGWCGLYAICRCSTAKKKAKAKTKAKSKKKKK